MLVLYFTFAVICSIYRCSSIEIKPELKRNTLNFGYGINYKYEGMLAHSFDRLCMVTKFILPSIQDLKFSSINYDGCCAYLNGKNKNDMETKKNILDLQTFCKKIEPYMNFYKKQIKSYNDTANKILENEINLMLPQITSKSRGGSITTLVSSFIWLA